MTGCIVTVTDTGINAYNHVGNTWLCAQVTAMMQYCMYTLHAAGALGSYDIQPGTADDAPVFRIEATGTFRELDILRYLQDGMLLSLRLMRDTIRKDGLLHISDLRRGYDVPG